MNLPAGISPGMPLASIWSIASPKRSPKSAEAIAAKELAGSEPSSCEASPAGGFLPLRLLLKSTSTWSEPGIRLATAVASSGSMPALSRNWLRFGVDRAAGLVDQAADVDEDIGDAAAGNSVNGARVALFVGQRFAVGGVDHLLEGRGVFGEDEEVSDDADRGAVVGLNPVVDPFVGAFLRHFVAFFGLLVDEVLGAAVSVVWIATPYPSKSFPSYFWRKRPPFSPSQGSTSFAKSTSCPESLTELSISETMRPPRSSIPPMLLARDSMLAFSSPSGRTEASMKSGAFGGARLAGSELESLLPPQPATASAAVAATAERTSRAFKEPPILAGGHSTVTVLARLRGWSTLRPRARAMS